MAVIMNITKINKLCFAHKRMGERDDGTHMSEYARIRRLAQESCNMTYICHGIIALYIRLELESYIFPV